MVMNHLLTAMILQVTSLRLVVFTKIHAACSQRRWARQLGNLQKCWVPWPTLEPGGTGPLTTVTTSLGFDATFGGLTVELNSLSLISTEGGKSFDTICSKPPLLMCPCKHHNGHFVTSIIWRFSFMESESQWPISMVNAWRIVVLRKDHDPLSVYTQYQTFGILQGRRSCLNWMEFYSFRMSTTVPIAIMWCDMYTCQMWFLSKIVCSSSRTTIFAPFFWRWGVWCSCLWSVGRCDRAQPPGMAPLQSVKFGGNLPYGFCVAPIVFLTTTPDFR